MTELKKQIRKEMIELRKNLPATQKHNFSQIINNKTEKLNLFQNASYILLYWSMPDEVDTHDLANRWKDKKNIILPVITGNELILRQYTGEMRKYPDSRFNLFEPAGASTIAPGLIDLVIVPGLAFDSENNRLGYGKGYYDRLLKKMQAYKIGICFNFQLLKSIPYTENDIKMDLVITN